MTTADLAEHSPEIQTIAAHCNAYKGADTRRSVFQLSATLVLFAATLGVMHVAAGVSWLLAAPLILPAAGLLTRLFIIQHDCGHGSFFSSRGVNDWTGRILGLLTLTPYDFWRRAHNMHHATSGDLDRRSIGGIDTITLAEYLALPTARKVAYRLYRHPVLLLLLGTPFYVIILQRIPFRQATAFHDGYKTLNPASIRGSILLNDVALIVFYGALGLLLGWGFVFAICLPVLVVTAIIGGWLFYIQHQFEETLWQRHEEWNLQAAALLGSSYYELPKILQWFTGNIGLHHIHHLCSKIPNYKLQECMDARPELAGINRLTLKESLSCLRLRVWDEERRRMVDLPQS